MQTCVPWRRPGDPAGAEAKRQAEERRGAREGGGPLTSRVWEVAGGGWVEGGQGGSHGGEAGARASRRWWPLKLKETKGYLFVALIADEPPPRARPAACGCRHPCLRDSCHSKKKILKSEIWYYSNWGHIWCTWKIGAHGAYIKLLPLILDLTSLINHSIYK
jgi:hypothetical protein